MPSPSQRPSTSGIDDTRARLEGFLQAGRRRWRQRTLLRGAVGAGALGAAAILVLGSMHLAGILPAALQPAARWVPLILALAVLGGTAIRVFRSAPSLRAMALRMDEVDGGDGSSPPSTLKTESHLPLIVLDLPAEHPYAPELARRMDRRLEGRRPGALLPPTLTLEEGGLGALLPGLAALLILAGGGPNTVWSEWGVGGPPGSGPVALATLADEVVSPPVDPFQDLRLIIEPPGYTGLEAMHLPAEEGVTALAGSRVRLQGGPEAGEAGLEVQLVREDRDPEPLEAVDGAGEDSSQVAPWEVQWTLSHGDRGLVVRSPGEGRERVIPLQVLTDEPPEVELLEPSRDMVLARGEGEVRFRARARDLFGVDEFHLSWVHTRGGGESFDFQEGSREWTDLERTEDGVEGTLTLDLGELGLRAGEVLHLRATASDRNVVTGPGTGVSRTRQIRVIREGDEMSVDALVGLPLDLDEDPVLSQRMLLLMTEDLLERSSELSREEVASEAGEIARQQHRLRDQVGEQVFSRATGAMQPSGAHLGSDHSHGDDDHRIAELLAHDHDPAHEDHDHDAADDEPSTEAPRGGSRYGVASIFDPSATEPDPQPAAPDHGHVHAGVRPGEAGTDVGRVTVGGLGELPVGFGELDDMGHHHDGDPILSVNQPLLAIYNAMWESARRLELVTPDASIPHQEEALEGLQALRENQRVFPRGRVSAPPVDVVDVRGTGEVDDADPAPRSPIQAVPGGDRWISAVEEAMSRLGASSTDLSAHGARLSELAIALLSDGSVSAQAGTLVAGAAELARNGNAAEAVQELSQVLRILAPLGERAETHRWPGASAGAASATFLGGARAEEGARAEVSDEAIETPPFVFATLRYESGNWDSGPLVPQNLIHALAQYTDLPVAPEGVVVDLSSREIFQYPVLYLTGHIPVRFSESESRNLKAYVERGGFVFMDDHNHDIDGAFHRTATEELARIFGEDALQPLPNDHELYRAFFHFEDGPPNTSQELSGWGDGIIHPQLQAVLMDGRIGILYSNKDYSSEWNYHAVNKRFLAVDNTRFGVNLLIYALTR